MTPVAELSSCFDLTDELIAEVLAPAKNFSESTPRDRLAALFARVAEIARPKHGGPKLLLVFSQLAGADWLDGVLEVRLSRDGEGTAVRVVADHDLGGTSVVPPFRLAVPLEELRDAALGKPEMLARLIVTDTDDDRLTLRAEGRRDGDARRSAIASALFAPRKAPASVGKIAAARVVEETRVPVQRSDPRADEPAADEPPKRSAPIPRVDPDDD